MTSIHSVHMIRKLEKQTNATSARAKFSKIFSISLVKIQMQLAVLSRTFQRNACKAKIAITQFTVMLTKNAKARAG